MKLKLNLSKIVWGGGETKKPSGISVPRDLKHNSSLKSIYTIDEYSLMGMKMFSMTSKFIHITLNLYSYMNFYNLNCLNCHFHVRFHLSKKVLTVEESPFLYSESLDGNEEGYCNDTDETICYKTYSNSSISI
ncbi:hypothetical protein Anas_10841 [Armadillidium nasatum]|uniref:Uncharacterized protein n=1 Tax=Armadillidium nasatum TaxID=96803 RepID=A0A5N5TF00_9CRUS|nr:hypothetical protein Anas_10841 [Armadillidium nasatum]